MYGNRRRIRGDRGKRLLRGRGEKLERTFAHLLVTGGLRRVQSSRAGEIQKRMLVHAATFNLALAMCRRFGFGTPRGLQGFAAAAAALTDVSAHGFAAYLGQFGRMLGLLAQTAAAYAPRAASRTPTRRLRAFRHLYNRLAGGPFLSRAAIVHHSRHEVS